MVRCAKSKYNVDWCIKPKYDLDRSRLFRKGRI